MTKPYLVSLYSWNEGNESPQYIKGRNNYLDSIKNLGDVETILVNMGKIYPGHQERWRFFPKNLDPNRWCILTDAADVIFQCPLPDLDTTGKSIILADEGIKFTDNQFWMNRFKKYSDFYEILDSKVYNIGSWIAKVSEIEDFLKFFFTLKEGERIDETPKWLSWLKTKKDNITTLPEAVMTLYDNMNLGLCKKEDELWKTKDGKVISIIHAQGSMKEFL